MAAPMTRYCKHLRSLLNFALKQPRSPTCTYAISRNNDRKFSTAHPKFGNGTVRIGCSSGFWGDTSVAAPQLIHNGNIDFLVADYLSEITMSLLTAAKQKSPELGGFAPDFVSVAIGPFLKDIKRKGIRVISNAGGVNPRGCAAALSEAAKKAGVELNIAVVTGDDLMSQMSALAENGVKEMESGMPFPKTIHSMNAYLGAGPIVRALDLGADIVVTGRCADSALALAPLMHTFKWQSHEFDKLASGSLAGHLIECGAQATGGIFTDWEKVKDWDNIGFPVVECEENGDFVLTKPPNTGGLVSVATASEQLTYEIGDPENYVLPDVVCDFKDVRIQPVEGREDAVHVSGVKGKPPTDTYKVSATYADGFRVTAVVCVGGPKSVEKATVTAEAIIKRTERMFKQLGLDDYTNTHLQVFGAEQAYADFVRNPALKDEDGSHILREAVMWLAAHHKQKKALAILASELAPAGTGMTPGFTALVGGRPRVSPVLKLFSFLHPKADIQPDIFMNGEKVETFQAPSVPAKPSSPTEHPDFSEEEKSTTEVGLKFVHHKDEHVMKFRLGELAYTRSGDKGNSVNIGVVARDPRLAPYIRQALTPESVDNFLGHLFEDKTGDVSERIQRYELPGIHAFNFVLKNALGGGGIASLRSDPQGKAVGQMMLDFYVKGVPYELFLAVKEGRQ